MSVDIFETAKENIAKFDRCNSKSVYDLADSIFKCFQEISEYDVEKTEINTLKEGLLFSVNLFRQFIPDKVEKKSISLSYIPEDLLKSIYKGWNSKGELHPAIGDSIELINACEYCINVSWELKKTISTIGKLLLLLIYSCLNCLIGDDVFVLINKCIILDNLGSQKHSSDLFLLLKKLNKKIEKSVLDSVQESEIQLVTGNLNYRLNNYKEAISSFCKYLDCYIKKYESKLSQVSEMEKMLTTLIYIAYCHEKINSAESLTKAIKLLEDVKSSKVIDLSNIDIEKNRMLIRKIPVQFDLCDDDGIKTEVFHALSHFYNERAVFHESQNKENDILMARKNISIAKSRDKDNAFHSCHGLLCHESTNYKLAITIYEEALELEAVKNDICLKNELLFYLAQSEYAIGDQESANNHLKEFTTFCDNTNEDALAHAGILQVKSELSRRDLFSKDLSAKFFHDNLTFIRERKPSLYVPVSVQNEWEKIICTINVFYYIYLIFKKEIGLPDGIEEVVYNLGKYKNKKHDLDIPKEKIKQKDKKADTKNKNGFYLFEYKDVKMLCFGNYLNLPSDIVKRYSSTGFISEDYEDIIIGELKNRDRTDVILFTPSINFEEQTDRIDLLKKILQAKVCIVVNNETARNLVNKFKDTTAIVHMEPSHDMFLQMSFCFSVYETLRYDLATPTPLLGLAPLESKSYSYQTGTKIKRLVVPSLNKARVAVSMQTKPLGRTWKFLDKARVEMQNISRSIIDYKCAIDSNLSFIEKAKEVLFMAFFPNPMDRNNEMGNFTAPFIIINENIFNVVKYFPSFRTDFVYSYPVDNFSTYVTDYSDCVRTLNDPLFCIDSCANEDGNDCDMESFANMTCLVTTPSESAQTTSVLNLLRHIIPVYEIEPNNFCLWRRIKIKNDTSGILLVIVNIDPGGEEELLHEICKGITKVVNRRPGIISFDVSSRQSKQVGKGQTQQKKVRSGKPKETHTPNLLSQELIGFVEGHFKDLEKKRERHYEYWSKQYKSEGSDYYELSQINEEKLSKIFGVINRLDELWRKKPPIIVGNELELREIWNKDPDYQKIMAVFKDCPIHN